MKKMMKITVYIITLGICLIMGIREFQLFQSWAGRSSYESSDGISLETAREILEAAVENVEMTDLVFWTQKSNQTVSTQTPVKRKAEINVILIFGDPWLLTGNYNIPQLGDTESCLMDETTAYQLFGSAEAVGASVEYDCREYRICGVMETPETTMIIQMPTESREKLTRITAADNGITGNWNLKNVLRNRFRITVTEIRWIYLRGIVKLLFCMMVMMFCLCLVRLLNRRLAPTKFNLVIEYVASVFILALLLKITGLTQIPSEYIPSKWSEFSFYAELLKTWIEGMKWFLETALSTVEIQWFMNCISLGWWVILGGMVSVLGLRSLEFWKDSH